MKLGDFVCIYNSVYKHIEDYFIEAGFIVSGGGLTLLDAYPDNDLIKVIKYRSDATGDGNEIFLPILTVEQENRITKTSFEIGSKACEITYPITMTIFAETSMQAKQLADAVDDCLTKSDMILYNYDNADYLNPTVSGTMFVDNAEYIPVNFIDTENPALKYGYDCYFSVKKLKV
jgi:hypothetical protein